VRRYKKHASCPMAALGQKQFLRCVAGLRMAASTYVASDFLYSSFSSPPDSSQYVRPWSSRCLDAHQGHQVLRARCCATTTPSPDKPRHPGLQVRDSLPLISSGRRDVVMSIHSVTVQKEVTTSNPNNDPPPPPPESRDRKRKNTWWEKETKKKKKKKKKK
jgi:hypothetical protein